MTDLSRPDLLTVYGMTVREEHFFLEAHQARLAFYVRVVLILIAATIVGLFLAFEWFHFAALCAGPILIYAVSSVARDGCFRLYQRYLEAVTCRAKIEQDLGMTVPRPEHDTGDGGYWATEPIVAPRHVTGRQRYRSSEIFILRCMKRGFHRWCALLFRGFEVLAGLAFAGLLFVAVVKAGEALGDLPISEPVPEARSVDESPDLRADRAPELTP